METLTLPIDQLRPAPYNPRVVLSPKDPRYRKLRRSLQEFGLVEPLVWNRRTGHVVGGHQRLRILRELGHTEVPVAVVDLPPEAEKALNLVLNNREAQADWDTRRLTELLEELAATPDYDFRQSGFDERSLETLRLSLEPAEDGSELSAESGEVEVVLIMSAEEYEAIRPELDALLQRHQIETHIRSR